MKKEEKYRNLLRTIKRYEPALHNRQELTDDIIRAVRAETRNTGLADKLLQFLFSWVGTRWMRVSMGMLTIGFIVVFSVQQLAMRQRISQLENQLIYSRLEAPGDQGLPIYQRLLLNMVVQEQDDDSITISKREFTELINNYFIHNDYYETGGRSEKLTHLLESFFSNNPSGSESENRSTKEL
ncbi:MAG: hypothetical protein WD578_13650 [Bacteroidales bacterium]